MSAEPENCKCLLISFFLPVQQVDLSNNSFTRVEIWKPTNPNNNLIAVDLGFNRIEGYLAANFAAYPLLSSLSMRYNRLRGPIPWEYSEKESLKRLFLDGNFLNGSPPKGFFKGGTSVSRSLGIACKNARHLRNSVFFGQEFRGNCGEEEPSVHCSG